MSEEPAPAEHRPFLTGLSRGLRHRCPNCGQGKLYKGYLKVKETCDVCGHDLGAYRADDGPAYFTILLVGHLVVAPLLLFPFIWQKPAWFVLLVTLIPLTVLILTLLPRVKGAFVGGLWSIRPAPQHG